MDNRQTLGRQIRSTERSVRGWITLTLASYAFVILFFLIVALGCLTVVLLFPRSLRDGDVAACVCLLFCIPLMLLLAASMFQVSWYLTRTLLFAKLEVYRGKREVTSQDCPKLFALMESIARDTGCKMPEHIYLSDDVGASLSCDAIGILSLFQPLHMNLVLGTGLLVGMNEDEVKAVLAHEFGHMAQRTCKTHTVACWLQQVWCDVGVMVGKFKVQQSFGYPGLKGLRRRLPYAWGGYLVSLSSTLFALHRRVQRGDDRLARLQEQNADMNACRIVVTRAVVSALYKSDILADRYNSYVSAVESIVGEGRYLPTFRAGCDLFYRLLSEDEGLRVSCVDVLSAAVGDESRYPSKVSVVNGWGTHPTLEERVRMVRQSDGDMGEVNLSDACELVPDPILDSVWVATQRLMAEEAEKPIAWSTMSAMDMQDFAGWAEGYLQNNRLPHFLRPFCVKRVISFSFPTDEEVEQTVDSPFTQAHRDLLLEFAQCESDWHLLSEINEEHGYEGGGVMYDGHLYPDCTEPMSLHERYGDTLTDRMLSLDRQVFRYLWQCAEDKEGVWGMYWALFYGNEKLQKMADFMDAVLTIRTQVGIRCAEESGFRLKWDVHAKLASDFWNFLHKADLQNLLRYCDTYMPEEAQSTRVLVGNLRAFLACKLVTDVTAGCLLGMIDELYSLLRRVFNMGYSQWVKSMLQAYRGTGENS